MQILYSYEPYNQDRKCFHRITDPKIALGRVYARRVFKIALRRVCARRVFNLYAIKLMVKTLMSVSYILSTRQMLHRHCYNGISCYLRLYVEVSPCNNVVPLM